MISQPTFDYERRFWQQGIALIAGVDEAGMGALAGPVVAAAVVFRVDQGVSGVRDSKQLQPGTREVLAEKICAQALDWSVAQASVEEITTYNIREAAILAIGRALGALKDKPDLALIDGNYPAEKFKYRIITITKGDTLSCSIAAASILAKVHRDEIMQELHQQSPQYGFSSHKGYGSAQHLTALKEHGPSPHHRPTYAPVAAVS